MWHTVIQSYSHIVIVMHKKKNDETHIEKKEEWKRKTKKKKKIKPILINTYFSCYSHIFTKCSYIWNIPHASPHCLTEPCPNSIFIHTLWYIRRHYYMFISPFFPSFILWPAYLSYYTNSLHSYRLYKQKRCTSTKNSHKDSHIALYFFSSLFFSLLPGFDGLNNGRTENQKRIHHIFFFRLYVMIGYKI